MILYESVHHHIKLKLCLTPLLIPLTIAGADFTLQLDNSGFGKALKMTKDAMSMRYIRLGSHITTHQDQEPLLSTRWLLSPRAIIRVMVMVKMSSDSR